MSSSVTHFIKDAYFLKSSGLSKYFWNKRVIHASPQNFHHIRIMRVSFHLNLLRTSAAQLAGLLINVDFKSANCVGDINLNSSTGTHVFEERSINAVCVCLFHQLIFVFAQKSTRFHLESFCSM